ncbi:P-loop containing nucleoside triphosphate hydrolase protein [Mycena belliarum]|uniref:P-loop containing nucleoside triphosphate hydrolase protein n=1 Tax=Mycena belliarum TaxID=1033014 RepID=A0AAD6XLZ8_9AGAR|nr:P-loop containing nucleoside triphosphate hydrolase protein [Mycena belliae]
MTSVLPFSLANYLSYGTLFIPLLPEATEQLQQEILPHQPPAEDDWSVFAANHLLGHLRNPEDDPLLRQLDFLALHRFIAASYALDARDMARIRIYLIPHDLPGVMGQLRVRKDKIVSDARRYLSGLLPKISRSRECWEGGGLQEPAFAAPVTTLAGIYEDLPSPQGVVTDTSTLVTRRLLDFSDGLGDLGIRSTLHRYQRRSVAAMVQKELDQSDAPDPLFFPVVGMYGEEFFLQPGTMELLLERPQVAPCRGGILCEELGTGKTVMILALVLSTLNQIPEPEPSIIDTRPVLTPLAFRHFPSGQFEAARKRFSMNKAKTDVGVPTLVELLLHRMATNPAAFVHEHRGHGYIGFKEDVDNLDQYIGPRKHNMPFYLDYQGEPTDNQRPSKRSRSTPDARMLYLTSATLVVVPPNLLLQWTQECSRHCEDSLRLCVLKKDAPMPSARTLASEYDIILITYPRFTAEDKNRRAGSSAWRACKCPEYLTVRVPNCVCEPPAGSPLLQVRWKRLVIDEGHVSASLSTVLTPFTKMLSVERRWIVTGTPTTNLLGLNLGTRTTETSVPPTEASVPSSPTLSEAFEFSAAEVSPVEPTTRVWTRVDGKDLTDLGNMITHFIRVPQLLAKPQLIDTHIKDALLDRRGPRIGSIEVLMQLMSSVMIRHRITDVEEEVILPPVSQEIVLLDLHPLAIKSYNALQAAIAINAVTSERKDQDYMFHPANVGPLQQTVQNMSQLMFWRTDDNYYNAIEQVRNHAAPSKSEGTVRMTAEDAQLYNNALHHLKLVVNDPLWRTIQNHEDVPYRVYDLERPIFEAWTRTTHRVDPNDSSLSGLIHPDRLLKLRQQILNYPLTSQEILVAHGRSTAEKDAKMRQRSMETPKRKKRTKSEQGSSRKAPQHAVDPNTVEEIKKHVALITEDMNTPLELNEVRRPSALVSQSPIAHTRLGSSASSKLNYIINEVLQHSPTEKFLIFSDSELSLAHIGEALQLIGVDYLRFTTQTAAEVRQQFVLTFETSEKYRVFLMELKHGARGLNLISASRVIFCEPVWRADVESQAIKRCHRIGQTRPITVKTLVIRGTAEENMAARRLALKDSKEKIPKLLEETGMRTFIANPKFITTEPTNLPTVDVPLVRLAPAVDEDAQMEDVGGPSSSPPRRRVQFNATPPRTASASKRPPDSDEYDDSSPRKRRVRLIPPDPMSPIASPKVRFA